MAFVAEEEGSHLQMLSCEDSVWNRKTSEANQTAGQSEEKKSGLLLGALRKGWPLKVKISFNSSQVALRYLMLAVPGLSASHN